MIIRNGIVDKVVRYNGWPVQIRNRYNTVGYIPNMTSNTTPSPYIASANFATWGPAYYAFSTEGGSSSHASPYNPIGNQNAYVQITLDRPVSIWKFEYACRVDVVIWDNATTVYFNVLDDEDNILYAKGRVTEYHQIFGGEIVLNTVSKRSAYYRMNFYLENYIAGNTWNPGFYNFQIYPFD